MVGAEAEGEMGFVEQAGVVDEVKDGREVEAGLLEEALGFELQVEAV